jgi:hypothetical protein
MFKHEVLEAFGRAFLLPNDAALKVLPVKGWRELLMADVYVNMLHSAIDFHIEDVDDLLSVDSADSLIDPKIEHLPYPAMWVDYRYGPNLSLRNGCLLIEPEHFLKDCWENYVTSDKLDAADFPISNVKFMVIPFTYTTQFNWIFVGCEGFILKSPMMKNGEPFNLLAMNTARDFFGVMLMYGLMDRADLKRVRADAFVFAEQAIEMFGRLLTLLTCKNIGQQKVTTIIAAKDIRPRKRGSHLKRRKKEIDYHILTLKLPNHVQKEYNLPEEVPFSQRNSIGGNSFMKRGHFKTFTEERPLFGKYTGTWWWEPAFAHKRDKGYNIKITS